MGDDVKERYNVAKLTTMSFQGRSGFIKSSKDQWWAGKKLTLLFVFIVFLGGGCRDLGANILNMIPR